MFGRKKQSKEGKKRMEHLMYLAKEKPDKSYDLSSCEMTKIPNGVYSLCKVLLKESLLLHSNFLKSIKTEGSFSDLSSLRILDLHDNKIVKLPPEVSCLINLQILNLENNMLSILPIEICKLKNLQTLNVKDNHLNCLPADLGKLSSLRTLDISGSNRVFYLPKSLAQIKTLEVIVLFNVSSMEYPGPHICQKGTEEIKKAICKDVGIVYAPPSHDLLNVLSNNTLVNGYHSHIDQEEKLQNEIIEYEKIKEKKRQQQMLVEKELAESQIKEASLAVKSMKERKHDVDVIKKENEKFEQMFQKQQEIENKKRKEMLNIVESAEQDANTLVQKLIQDKEKSEQREKILAEIERQRVEEEECFRVSQQDIDNLRKKETLAAMNLMIQEHESSVAFVNKYLNERDVVMSRTKEEMSAEEQFMNKAIERQISSNKNLVQNIMEEDELQLIAFRALRYSMDEKRQRIVSQIVEIEQELTKLTSIEATRQKMKMDVANEVLSLERQQLTDMLAMLLKEKDQREKDIKGLLDEMEQQRENDQIDFWLVQYQRLLDSKPEPLLNRQSEMRIDVIKLLNRAGCEHHIPSFARHKINTINMLAELTDEEIKHIGVFEIGLRKSLLSLIESEVIPQLKKLIDPVFIEKSGKQKGEVAESSTPAPVVPVSSTENADYDLLMENECVVCLDKQSDCVLLPCGHVCTCIQCSATLVNCPMCRESIAQKIKLFRT